MQRPSQSRKTGTACSTAVMSVGDSSTAAIPTTCAHVPATLKIWKLDTARVRRTLSRTALAGRRHFPTLRTRFARPAMTRYQAVNSHAGSRFPAVTGVRKHVTPGRVRHVEKSWTSNAGAAGRLPGVCAIKAAPKRLNVCASVGRHSTAAAMRVMNAVVWAKSWLSRGRTRRGNNDR